MTIRKTLPTLSATASYAFSSLVQHKPHVCHRQLKFELNTTVTGHAAKDRQVYSSPSSGSWSS